MEKKYLLIILAIFMFSSLPASINIFGEGEPLTVYPNPASDIVKIDFESDFTAQPVIKIIDLTGKTVLKLQEGVLPNAGVFKAQFDVSSLKSGIYFVKVEQKDKVHTKKLIVR